MKARLARRFSPGEVRRMLEELGPIFVKVGQYLALRPDLIPQAYADELLRMTDTSAPYDFDEFYATLTRELGRNPLEVFESIERRPAGTGSLAQVHVARLPGGAQVAVKVLRPDIEQRVERDLARARTIVRLLKVVRVTSALAPAEVVGELADWLRRELDLRNELANTQRMYELTRDSPVARAPRPYPELCSRRVLVVEYLRGIPLTEILRARSSETSVDRERVDRLAFDARRFALNLAETCFRQIFIYQFFHADIHPGNLMVLENDVIGFVDLGLCDRLDPGIRESQSRYLAAIYSGDTEQILRALIKILEVSDDSDVEAFRRDYLAQIRQLGFEGDTAEGTDGSGSRFGSHLIAIMRAARNHRLKVPPRVLSLYRTLLTLDGVTRYLGVNDALQVVGNRFFPALQLTQAIKGFEVENLAPVLLANLDILRDGPRAVSQLLADAADGSYELKVRVAESRRQEGSRARASRLTAVGLVSISLALLLVASLPPLFGVDLRYVILAALLGAYTYLAVLMRRL